MKEPFNHLYFFTRILFLIGLFGIPAEGKTSSDFESCWKKISAFLVPPGPPVTISPSQLRWIQEEKLISPLGVSSDTFQASKNWMKAEKLRLNGSESTLTFSFDGEIPWDEVLEYVKKDPLALNKFDELFAQQQFNKRDLMKILGISEKQFDLFVFRKGTPFAGKNSWRITELPPRYFAFMMERLRHDYPNMEKMAKIFEKTAERRRLSVSTHLDDFFIEVTHPSFEIKPYSFESTVRVLNRHFPKSTQHLHVGLPVDAVSTEQAITIARAVEMKIILQLSEKGNIRELPYYDFSSLHPTSRVLDDQESRGLIRLGIEEFDDAHNLEIRQYQNINDGMNLVKFTADLSVQPEALYIVKNLKVKKTIDKFTSNLNGALRYAAILFTNKATPESLRLAEALLKFSDEIESSKEISPLIRMEVRRFLEKNHILDQLNDRSLYLKTN